MKEETKAKDYFTRVAKEFDDIYENRGGTLTRLANLLFRKGMYQRFALTLEMCGSGRKTVLDIGCGAGRFTIPLAERGMDVLGIDYSPEMIRLAEGRLKARAEANDKALKIRHICCDFLSEFEPEEKFDVTLAIGVFDYLKDPLSFLKKMKDVTKGALITAFPALYTPQMPIRKVWLAAKGCPVYFYTVNQIAGLHAASGINDYEIMPIAAAYLVKAKLTSHP